MICFPLDNTQYDAGALGAWFAARGRGVLCAQGNLAVRANGGMSVEVLPGIAWLRAAEFWGVVAHQQQALVLEAEMADAQLARVDAVCLRLDRNNNMAELVLKRGEYAIAPVPPALVRDVHYDEIYLAAVSVAAGAVELTPADITDLRLDEEYCGLMRDGVTGIPTAQLQAQAEALMSMLRGEIAGINAGSEVMLQTAYDPSGAVAAAGGVGQYAVPKSGGAMTGNLQAASVALLTRGVRNIYIGTGESFPAGATAGDILLVYSA